MASPTKSYFIDINRFSAQDNLSEQTNIWDYNLNDTIVAPAGSAISIHQAFINQKGITGQSIEFNEDMSEQFNYYFYIVDDLHPVPILGESISTRKHQPQMIDHQTLQVNLLNNTTIGRNDLFGFDVNSANSNWFHPLYLGGSGAPLILSESPSISNHQNSIVVNGNITTNNSVTGRVGTFASGSHVITLDGQNSPSGIRIGAVIGGAGVSTSPDANTITAIDVPNYTITILYATTTIENGTPLTITNTPNSKIEFIGNGTTTNAVNIGARILGNGIKPNTFVGAKTLNSITMIDDAGAPAFPTATLGTAGETAADDSVGVNFDIWNDHNYYTQPVAQSATINIKKGIYGIEQLINIINKQINNQYKTINGVKSQIPQSNVDEALINQNWNGMLNPNNAGLTTIIDPIDFRTAPDGVVPADINPSTTDAVSHCFIPALDYAKIQVNATNNLIPAKINFSTRIDGAHADKGYLGFLQNNKTAYRNMTTGGVIVPDNNDINTRNLTDYQIGVRGLTIGAPEFNLQYDTQLSGFSLNSLHTSYKIPSYDLLGKPNANSGKDAVGLKRVAEILDVAPFTSNMNIFGDATQTSPTNITYTIEDQQTNVYLLGQIQAGGKPGYGELQLGALVSGNQIATGSYITDFAGKNSKGEFGLLVSLPIDNNGDRLDEPMVVVNSAVPTAQKTKMISSYETPLSRVGGVIIHNFAYKTAEKYGDKFSEINTDSPTFLLHGSFKDFFRDESTAKQIWKTKTIWGKLGFSYEQLNSNDYMENIVQYTNDTSYKLRGITTNSKLDISAITGISTANNSTQIAATPDDDGKVKVDNPQNFNLADMNTPRTQRCRRLASDEKGGAPSAEYVSDNQFAYSGSRYEMATMINVIADPSPITAESLPTLSDFGYYLITSDLVPTYKDIVSKGDPIGLLGVVAKTNLSNQDFIPLAQSDIVQQLNQTTIINNIRIKILNPNLTNPQLSENSSVILRIDVPVEPPPVETETHAKKPKKKCPKTGETPCKCPKNEKCDKAKLENLHKVSKEKKI
tara:strand:- start:182 stop:3274 length:3093 start_codon:yes stop_codon:yes gene_type:complete